MNTGITPSWFDASVQSGCSLNQCVSRLAHVTYIVADNALFNMVLRWSTQARYQKHQYAYDASNTGAAAKKLQDSLTRENGGEQRHRKSIQSALFQGGHPRVLSQSALLLLSHGVE